MKRKSLIFAIRIALFMTALSFVALNLRRMNSNFDLNNVQRFLSLENLNTTSSRKKPSIYTFFHRIDPSKKGTGMSEKSDEQLLNTWKDKWSKAGWDPVVLTLEDAKKHPGYRRFARMVNKIPLMGKGGKGLNILYNQLCYYRWLAMASVGGGWMSDYDVFPLRQIGEDDLKNENTSLPNGGFFSVHAIVRGSEGQGIPCLMSGNDKQWEKMAFMIVENGASHFTERMWTDMFALMDLRTRNKKKELFHWADDVIPGQEVLLGHYWSKKNCTIIKNYKAVHFSHDAIFNGKINNFGESTLPGVRTNWNKMDIRAAVVLKWFEMWKEICKGSQLQ